MKKIYFKTNENLLNNMYLKQKIYTYKKFLEKH